MPELPEVETIRRGIEAKLRGARIEAVEVREARLRRPIDLDGIRGLVGRRIEGVSRRAKYILADVGDGLVWLLHLGMSGRVRIEPRGAPPRPHEHVRVRFDRPLELLYCDPRRFGLMRLAPADSLVELRGLGPEPLDPAFDGVELRKRLRGTHRDVKAALLDQRVVAGVGNIYASEILFRAGVLPTRRCHRLRRREIDAIAEHTRAVLTEAVERRGTSFSDYFDSDGIPGSFQQVLRVFDRAGLPCAACGSEIRRRVHGGRSSFYCARCQG